ncbi:MAG: adenylate/guanylate cyclase domain-containing protein [Kiloniellaceae bacterium]
MSQQKVSRRLVAIFAADVVGYSRLMRDDEEGTLATLRAYRDVMDGLVGEYDGRVFAGEGDSVMAEFPSPVQAVRCAARIQEELERRNAELPEARRMHFRIGVNLGDVMVEDGNLFGDAVNIAARLQGLAIPGGICISDSIYQQIRHKVTLGYEHLGELVVKNIAEPIVAYHVLTTPEAAGKILGRKWARTRGGRRAALAAIVVLAVVAGGIAAWLRPWTPAVEPGSGKPSAFPQIARPGRHFRVARPAELADADALTIYDRILDDMVAVYRKSGNPHAGVYHTWRRYNTVPYLSATHGRRYVNNYANDPAKAYGRFEEAGTLPAGSVLAKDSFEVTDRGDVHTGPLSLMEKMQPGFNPEGRDWRYTMILPDGALFGTTNGEGSERVEFCMECHIAAGDEQDHLFFVPARHRVRFLNLDAPPD